LKECQGLHGPVHGARELPRLWRRNQLAPEEDDSFMCTRLLQAWSAHLTAGCVACEGLRGVEFDWSDNDWPTSKMPMPMADIND